MILSLALPLALSLVMPAANPRGTINQLWEWRGQSIRYQALGDERGPAEAPSVVFVHGLFVNADHWRQNLDAVARAGYRAYAIDLLGYGYSSKPSPTGLEAAAISGEARRDLSELPVVDLGSASGARRPRVPVEQRHPVVGSCYNFFTWSEQLVDFVEQVVGAEQATFVCNSIGSISSLQAAVDRPDLVNGVMIVNPNFRELHVAEQPDLFRPIMMPLVSAVQATLRERGHGLFNALAKPDTVKQILKEPYHNPDSVTDELVDVLLTPLLLPGSADVVFDTLSYSAGPLPEQLLQDDRLSSTPVWVCYGEKDPWTPAQRVEALSQYAPVERVLPLQDVGHCPHDEAPEKVNPLIVDFLQRVAKREGSLTEPTNVAA